MNQNIFVVRIKRNIWFPFSFAYIKDVFRTVVDFTLIASCVIVIILAATLGYLKYQNDLNRPWATLKGNEVRTKQELRRVERKFGVHALETNNRGEWGCYVDGKWWPGFPKERRDK